MDLKESVIKSTQEILVKEFGEDCLIQRASDSVSWNFIESCGYMCSLEFVDEKCELTLNNNVYDFSIDRFDPNKIKSWVRGITSGWTKELTALINKFGLQEIPELKKAIEERKDFKISLKKGILELETDNFAQIKKI